MNTDQTTSVSPHSSNAVLAEEKIKVDKGVPMPFAKTADKFPFAEMTEVGDSFFCNEIKGGSCYVYALQWAKKNNVEWKFKWKEEKDGFRMWRVS